MKRISVLLITLVMIFSACTKEKTVQPEHREEPMVSQQQEESKESVWKIAAERCGKEYVFSARTGDFIREFNSLCGDEFGEDYLRPIGEWTVFEDNSIFTGKDAVRYEFKTSQGNYIEPTIWIVTPKGDDRIMMLSVQFDDHGYAEWAYDVYKDYSYYAIKTFIKSVSEEDIGRLFELLNDSAYSEECMVSPGATPTPEAVYYREETGFFAYYHSGMVHLCIIPVTDDRLSVMRNNGAKLTEIKD